jgi:hypothetical protein
MKYGLYDVIYGPGAAPFVGGRNLAGLSPLAQHSACCVSVILTLAARRDNGDDIGLRALEKLGARFSPTRAETIARAMRTELTEAHAWIAATQAERLQSFAVDAEPDGDASADKQHEVDQSLEAQHAPVDDVALASESLARQLERTGETGKELATELREASRRRMRQYREGSIETPAVLLAWMPNDAGESPILVALAEALWKDRIKPSRSLQVKTYVKMPKYVGGVVPWAAGAPAVELDGSRFCLTANAPAKVFGPRSLALLPDGLDLGRAHKAILPLDYNRDDNTEAQLALAVVNPAQVALSPAGSKIALLALGDPHVLGGGIATIPAKELATLIHSGQRYQGRMLKTAAEGLSSIRTVMLYLPDATRVQMFSVRDLGNPTDVKADTLFGIALDKHFQEAVWQSFRSRGSTWSGSFVLDITGAMSLPMQQPELLRLHVRASVRANAAFSYGTGKFDGTKLTYESLTEIAARVNSIDIKAAELLAANGKLPRSAGRRAVTASERRKKLRETMGDLEGRGLWRVDKEGRDRYRLLPTEKYLEAWSGFRGKKP